MRSWFPGRKTARAWRGAPILVLVLLCRAAPCGSAEIYRCSTPDGGTIFSDTACGEDALVVQGKASARVADARAAAPARQAGGAPPKGAVLASTLPASGSQPGARSDRASAPAPPRAAAPWRAAPGDESELENLAYLRAMGEQCPLATEHTQVLRILDMLATDRLARQGIRPTLEEGQRRAARVRERAQHDVAGARQSACAEAARRLVALAQTRVHFEVLAKPLKPGAAPPPPLDGGAPAGG